MKKCRDCNKTELEVVISSRGLCEDCALIRFNKFVESSRKKNKKNKIRREVKSV